MICRAIYGEDCDREVVSPSWFHKEHWLEDMGGGKLDWRSPGPSIRADVPPQILRILAQSSAAQVRQAVAAARQVPDDIVDRLCDDPDRDVRISAFGHTHDEAWLRRGATLSDPFMRRSVAQNPATPTDVLALLATDPDPGPREGVTLNRQTSAEWIDRMAGGDSSARVRWSALKRTGSPTVVAEAVRSPAKEVRAGAASNPLLTEVDMGRLATDPEPFVRYTLARFGRLPGHLQLQLLHDPDQTVRLMLARNERLPRELLVQLLHDDVSLVRVGASIAWRARGLDPHEL